ncbi:alanine racemase [Deinococcus koreensis]|uniref:YggS family pyridoxal phosphate enzyme n=1 Tax=Deinococcus koreensis TaxID=2054903 RepID=A0A2K3V0N7_9DEIO|nr:alanine racemase [Deinococcus koreensis]PNY82344.1 YggS family pyridoxal phosphate enzyme [Deinococcus koreensis]
MSLPDVLAGLRSAEREAGRPQGSVGLVAITKGHGLPEIQAKVLDYGAFPLGENRGQELRDKAALRPDLDWHFIGPIQRNKIKYLAPVRLIHTIEATWQAEAIAQAAERWGHAPEVLLQLHNGEPQKHGIPAADLAQTLREVQATGLTVRGLMVMAPEAAAQGIPDRGTSGQPTPGPDSTGPDSTDPPSAAPPSADPPRLGEDDSSRRILQVFMETARRAHDLGLSELSMGMSGDYPLAVRAGATLIRVGRSLFS